VLVIHGKVIKTLNQAVYVIQTAILCILQSERCDHNYGQLAAAMEEERMSALVSIHVIAF
jgi:hypothetical protein